MNIAQGRLDYGPPVAVIDIGSNSVRLVVYEGLTRSPTPIFNEKVLAGLGREVQSTGLLAPDAVEKALAALRRFRALCDRLNVARLWAIATAACRDADNGKAFVAEAERICGTKIDILSGKREAELSALGVVSGFYRPDGIVGDLGGGSLELTELHGHRIKTGVTLPLGGLALQDVSSKSVKKAEKIVRLALGDARVLENGKGRTFYAIGGTWRALARLHMWQTGYPLHVMHGYVLPAKEAFDFASLVHRVNPEILSQIEVVTDARRPLLAYAALVLENLVRIAKPKDVVISALGVREGLLYQTLDAEEREKDPLIAAASELNVLRSRSPAHGEELTQWTDRFMASAPCRLPPGRHRLARASGLSRRAVAQHHRQRRLCRGRSSRPHLHLAGGVLPPCRTGRRGALAAAARARLDARARPRARARRGAAGRLSRLGLDHRGAAEDADGGRAWPPGAAVRERLQGARRRSRVRPIAPARPPDRPRAGDGRVALATLVNRRSRTA
jgi:exopolyphosphatase/guanosine-5'-triphosphate,3'-diphosphate pyrophosphatase